MFSTLAFALAISLSGCLSESSQSTAASSADPTPPGGTQTIDLGFAGVDKVQNLDGNSIKVSWLSATSPKVIGYRIYEIAGDGSLSAIQQVDPSKTAFIHTGLVLGSTHSYLVKAISNDGKFDPNTVVKSMFTYGGASSVSVTGLTTATVYFSPAATAINMNIYYKDNRGGDWVLAGSVASTASSFNVTGLKSGTTYTFRVLAVDASGTEDTNPIAPTAQTYSNSFNPPAPMTAKYNGYILGQAYGPASGAPAGTPTSAQVTVSWVAFSNSLLVPTSYALIRTSKGSSINLTTSTPCTSSTTGSCQVCTVSGIGNQSCTDTNVGVSPAAYDYVVTMLASSNWPEELPSGTSDAPYRLTVQIPPANMVLVQRDSVNYEMCQLLGKTPDPLNHQRCAISGGSMVGATAYNTNPGGAPLGLSWAYYDFGYNVFVDRWQAACNWTPVAGTYAGQTNNGMCGAGATAGDCFGNAAPSGTVGVPGNVFYNTASAICYVKNASNAWVAANSTLTTPDRNALVTFDPQAQGGYRPPIATINQANAQLTCAGNIDPNYGAKRILRRREFVAASAWAKFVSEPNYMDDTAIANVEASAATNPHTAGGGYQCNTASHKALAAGAFKTTNLAGDAGDAVKSFNIGSLETSKCVSRFGAQDLVGNVWEWNSDQMYCNSSASPIVTPYSLNAYVCMGTPSTVDTGNGYVSGFDMNGFMFDGSQGPGGSATVTEWVISTGSSGASYFNTALGLPMVSTDNGNSILVSTNSAKLHGDYFWININNGNTSRGLYSGGNWGSGSNFGRWAASWYLSPSSTGNYIGFRCALPAE